MGDKREGDFPGLDTRRQIVRGTGQRVRVQSDLFCAVGQAIEIGTGPIRFGQFPTAGDREKEFIMRGDHSQTRRAAVPLVML